ncbi:MAG: hypothetical protein QM765_24980 [Myxococcales bacterium]
MRTGLPELATLLAISAAALGCGGSGRTVAWDGGVGLGLTCYDANGTYVGPYRAYDGVCLHAYAGYNWKVDQRTAELRPVFDDDALALAWTMTGCTGVEMVRCFEAPCMQDTFVTWDGKVRAARRGSSMEMTTLRSYYEPKDPGAVLGWDPGESCEDYRVAMDFLAVPLYDCPEAPRPFATFEPPLRRSP